MRKLTSTKYGWTLGLITNTYIKAKKQKLSFSSFLFLQDVSAKQTILKQLLGVKNTCYKNTVIS